MIDATEHRAEVEAWRSARYAALRRDTGWLTLAGLDWLRPGSNRVGSDPTAEVVLPSGPAVAGVLEVEPEQVTATGAWIFEGAPVDRLPLVDDRDGQPTLLELGSLRQCLIERGGRRALRTWDLASPTRTGFTGIEHWPVDPAWRLTARVDPTPDRTIAVPDVFGGMGREASPADLAFEIEGVSHRLQALPGGGAGELWLIFGDTTNGHETYGGGRYLYTDPPAADGTVVVDFNRAYNPPCVFTPYATCWLPWPANRLRARVEAGERTDGRH
ncbi:MAG TPA: DUF1684 domain-containing protein [Candidatus Limnocylindria bacterium]